MMADNHDMVLEEMRHKNKMEELKYKRETERLKHENDLELHRITRADDQKLARMKHEFIMEQIRGK
jgi:hypothetical protein